MASTRTVKRLAVVAASAAAVTAVAVGGASAIGGDDEGQDRAIPGADREQAEEAALRETGGGAVTGTEVGDEESRYEVEVTLDDGTQVDIQLDEHFRVVATETDGSDESTSVD